MKEKQSSPWFICFKVDQSRFVYFLIWAGDRHGVCHSVHVEVGAQPLRKNLLLMFINSFDQVCSSGIVALNLRVVSLRIKNDIFTAVACQIS